PMSTTRHLARCCWRRGSIHRGKNFAKKTARPGPLKTATPSWGTNRVPGALRQSVGQQHVLVRQELRIPGDFPDMAIWILEIARIPPIERLLCRFDDRGP